MIAARLNSLKRWYELCKSFGNHFGPAILYNNHTTKNCNRTKITRTENKWNEPIAHSSQRRLNPSSKWQNWMAKFLRINSFGFYGQQLFIMHFKSILAVEWRWRRHHEKNTTSNEMAKWKNAFAIFWSSFTHIIGWLTDDSCVYINMPLQ